MPEKIMNSKKQAPAAESSLEYSPVFKMNYLMPRYWLTWFGVFFLWSMMFTPVAFRNTVAKLITIISCKTNKKRYRIAKKNLLMCFPDKSESELNQMVRKFFYYQSRILLDYAFLWFSNEKRLKKLYLIKHDGELRGLKKLDQNIILLTCHMLALDHGAQALSMDNHIVGLIKPMKNPVTDWLVARGRTRFNTHLYERTYGMMGVISSIKSGDQFFYLPDEDLGKSQSVFLPFFGVQKATITALGRLAKICDAKVVPCVSIFNDETGQYEIHFMPSLSSYPTGDKVADALTMNQVIEKLILKAPEQYIWTFRYFKTRPTDESSVY